MIQRQLRAFVLLWVGAFSALCVGLACAVMVHKAELRLDQVEAYESGFQAHLATLRRAPEMRIATTVFTDRVLGEQDTEWLYNEGKGRSCREVAARLPDTEACWDLTDNISWNHVAGLGARRFAVNGEIVTTIVTDGEQSLVCGEDRAADTTRCAWIKEGE